MAVNVSVRQLVRPGFAAEVLNRLVELGIEPARLTLEARESQLMEQPDVALAGILEVHSTGVHIAIDDFGTGLTSVTYLRDLPATALKIDPSLVAALSQPGQDRGVVGAIVRLAHGLGMQTIAEGVETEEQLVQVRAVGSDFAQGYLLGEPLPGAAIRLPARRRGGTGRE
jgi:EAL domain-containing protein (putative c-di-GMP-specific phosphodiesterase class I)